MSVIGSNILAGASGQGGGYNLTKSLRFRRSASAYLNRTPASASNRRTYTWSAWVKRSELSSNQSLFAVNATGDYQEFRFTASNTLQLILDASALNYAVEVPTVVWRDVSAWYHIVLAVDTTQATSTNRVKIYVNGIQQTVSAVSGFSFPAQNFDTYVNATLPHAIGNFNYLNSAYFNGYMTEINFIDGQALTPSSFGETSTTTGVWQPKKYTGTYGTNGFYLPFTDTTSTSTLGTDFSGNSNTWTVNNISLTAGVTYDSMTDVPTLTDITTANYATLNPLMFRIAVASPATLSNGNLTSTHTPSGYGTYVFSTIAGIGNKFYYEVTITSLVGGGDVGINDGQAQYSLFTGGVTYLNTGNKIVNGSSTAYGSSYTTGDVIGVAFDLINGTITFYKNNTSQGVASSSIGTSAYFAFGQGDTGSVYNWNFGQRPFAYTPPTGFVALNTYNLPTPTIGATASSQANKYMDATTYTGTGSSLTVTNSGSMQPDCVWIKNRTGANNHARFDSVRGATLRLYETTLDEQTEVNTLTAFNSNGFSVGSAPAVNSSSNNYVAWQWRANGSGSTNTAGSITSTVSANTTAGFSIVTYTGTGANATVGHGLGVAPSMIIVKRRDAVAQWNVYHTSIGATGRLYLNATDATNTSSAPWNNTAPTSSVFTVGTASDTNQSSSTIVAYCFAQVAGYSAFGSYTGNGSSDGTFVYTGFRPRFVLMKATTGSNNWIIYDTSRNTYNLTNLSLVPDSSAAENGVSTTTENTLDILSNGFKLRTSNALTNGSSVPYIYMAFAETPFRYANAR